MTYQNFEQALPMAEITGLIADIPDFPEKGIIFKDITPVLANRRAFVSLIQHMAQSIDPETTHLAAIESRGFILGAALAQHIDKGLVLVRKPGKLPRPTEKLSYDLEYGSDALEIQIGDIGPGDKVTIIDDVLATGGTAHATEQLCQKMGCEVIAHRFLIELVGLKGGAKLSAPYESFVQY